MYKILQELEDVNLLDKLVKQGILSITIAGHKLIYEIYLKELKSVKKSQAINKASIKSQAITNTSTETKTPERTIYRIIKKMESK